MARPKTGSTNWIKLTIGATLFLTTYTITAPLTGAKDQIDLRNLMKMLKELGPLYNISNFIQHIIEEILLRACKPKR